MDSPLSLCYTGIRQSISRFDKHQEVIAVADRKKEQERNELHRAIWAIADELRGAVDGWNRRQS